MTRELLERDDAPVIALGGGALVSAATRALVRERAFCAWLDVPFAVAWERVEGAPGARPLAGDRTTFDAARGPSAEQYTARPMRSWRATAPPRGRRGAGPAGLDARRACAQLALGERAPSRSSTRPARSRERAA